MCAYGFFFVHIFLLHVLKFVCFLLAFPYANYAKFDDGFGRSIKHNVLYWTKMLKNSSFSTIQLIHILNFIIKHIFISHCRSVNCSISKKIPHRKKGNWNMVFVCVNNSNMFLILCLWSYEIFCLSELSAIQVPYCGALIFQIRLFKEHVKST